MPSADVVSCSWWWLSPRPAWNTNSGPPPPAGVYTTAPGVEDMPTSSMVRSCQESPVGTYRLPDSHPLSFGVCMKHKRLVPSTTRLGESLTHNSLLTVRACHLCPS